VRPCMVWRICPNNDDMGGGRDLMICSPYCCLDIGRCEYVVCTKDADKKKAETSV
jgi:hypothetical protein